jgi:hypothetical protein
MEPEVLLACSQQPTTEPSLEAGEYISHTPSYFLNPLCEHLKGVTSAVATYICTLLFWPNIYLEITECNKQYTDTKQLFKIVDTERIPPWHLLMTRETRCHRYLKTYENKAPYYQVQTKLPVTVLPYVLRVISACNSI